MHQVRPTRRGGVYRTVTSETVARPVAIPIAPPVARPALEPPPASVKEGVRHLVQEALQRDAIGDNAPFSALGMDSLMSASLCKDIERAFGVELDYRTLWAHASVQRLSEWIEGKNRNQAGLLTKSLVSLHGDPSAPRKVVCFPCAGGSPAMFHGWGALVPSDVELLALQIPGQRELSSQDVPVTIEQYVAAVSPHVHERLRGNELHFVGHSMGAIVAYELARHLSASYGMMPVQLFAIASMAPEAAGRKTDFVASARDNLSVLFPSYSQPMESSVRDDLVELLMRDLKLLDSYEFDGENFAKLDIVGVLGAQDKALERQDMEGWARLSERHEQHLVEGDHVSVLNAQATLEILGRRLARETGAMRLSQ
jgi:pyochelin biosynthetic protein PchC